MSLRKEKMRRMSRKMRERAKRKRRKLILSFIIAAVVAAVSLTAYFIPFRTLLPAYSLEKRCDGELRLHFPDVGQGACSIVEFPSGDVLVIDAGDGSFSQTNKLVRYIKGLKPKSLGMLLTHADVDHYGGFEAFLEVFDAETFYLPVFGSESDDYISLLKRIKKKGCKTKVLKRYDVIADTSGAYLVALSPYSIDETNGNDSSTVLYLQYGNVKALFCGDISATRERQLVSEYALDETLFDSCGFEVRLRDLQILSVPHHGSASSSSSEWLGLIKPETAVISCGAGNAYAHPSDKALARLKGAGAEIYRLDELGDIVISVYSEQYTVKSRSGEVV